MEGKNCNYAVAIAIVMTMLVIISILTQVKSIVMLTEIDRTMLKLH